MNIMAWLFVIIWFVCYLLSLCNQITISNKMLIYGIIHVVWAFLLLIAGAVIADAAAALKKICDAFGIQCTVAKLEAAAAFGIITSFIFLGDGILHIYQHKKPKTTSSISATENGDAVKPSPPPNQTSNSEEIKS
eukprot:TCONS_00008624-protein